MADRLPVLLTGISESVLVKLLQQTHFPTFRLSLFTGERLVVCA